MQKDKCCMRNKSVIYDLDAFYSCRALGSGGAGWGGGCLLCKNIVINEHRFDGFHKYLPRGMVNTKQPTVYLGYKRCLNMMVSCARSCLGALFKK